MSESQKSSTPSSKRKVKCVSPGNSRGKNQKNYSRAQQRKCTAKTAGTSKGAASLSKWMKIYHCGSVEQYEKDLKADTSKYI